MSNCELVVYRLVPFLEHFYTSLYIIIYLSLKMYKDTLGGIPPATNREIIIPVVPGQAGGGSFHSIKKT